MLIEPSSASDSAPLSVDQAVAALRAQPAEAPAPAPAATPEPHEPEEPHAPSEPTDEHVDAPAAPAGEDAPQTPEPAAPAVEPPHFWDADAKADFALLPPKLQEVALAQWRNGERLSNKALEDAATARKAADEVVRKAEAETAAAASLNQRLGDILPKVEEQFKDKWAGVTSADWYALSQKDPDAYTQLKALHDHEQSQLQQLQAARQDAARRAEAKAVQERQAGHAAEMQRLVTLEPELADPVKGPHRAKALGDYLKAQGVTPEMLQGAKAIQLQAAYKAMKWDEAQKAVASATPPKTPAAQPAAAPVRPAAAQPQSRQTTADKAMEKLSKSGSRDDALAVLRARRNKG